MDIHEILNLIIALLLMAFVIGFKEFTISAFVSAFIVSLIIIFVFVVSQIITANFLGLKISFRLWTFRRYWFRWQDRLNWDFPSFVVFPLLLGALSSGALKWTSIIVFDAETTEKRVTKRFYEIKEFDFALVAASGILAILTLALIFKIFMLGSFASLLSWFALLNLLPLGNMNGTKIFFGSKYLWVFLVALSVFIVILINLAHVIATIFIALILAAIAALIIYYLYERKK